MKPYLTDSAGWSPSQERHRAIVRANRTRKGEHARAAERSRQTDRAEARKAEARQALARQRWS